MPTRHECANAIRALAIDAIEKAKSGHPGAPLGMAEMAEALWRHVLKFNPANPQWLDRDRFILSNGHASMLLYALLHLTGFELPMREIQNFRQWQSQTPGHPERGRAPGVEMTTGPLGQGIASAVGFALAEAMLAAQFNKPGLEIVNHYTYVFCGDGCLMEGVSHEACSLAGSWRLGKLIVFYDANGVSIDGKIDPWFNEDERKRFEAYNWQVIGPIDGHDSEALDEAIAEAKIVRNKPSLVICHTHIGYGSPKRDDPASHGAPLGEEAAMLTKKALGWARKPFEIPKEIYDAWSHVEKGAEQEKKWRELFVSYELAYPREAKEFKRRMAGELPTDWSELWRDLIKKAEETIKAEATRVASKNCLEILVPGLPELVGGSADLSSSVGALTKSSEPYDPSTGRGNYLYYGAREFGMGAIMNGLAMHGGIIPYAGTFLSFSDQAKNALRLAALMKLRVIWIMTHDSIGVGEDGPTHQPVEQISTLRMIPNMLVWRPCDNVETAWAWISALNHAAMPACLILSRQKLEQVKRSADQIQDIAKGGYILRDCEGTPQIILIATGSEVQLALQASLELESKGYKTRVVSMPCCEIYDAQDQFWHENVLPKSVKCRLAIEAASSSWWNRYVGLDGACIGMDTFGASAPASDLFKNFGFSVENVVKKAEEMINK